MSISTEKLEHIIYNEELGLDTTQVSQLAERIAQAIRQREMDAVVGTAPQALGELLRSFLFEGEYGCYTSFEVRSDAQVMDAEDRERFWDAIGWFSDDPDAEDDNQLIIENSRGYRFDFQGYQVQGAYYWDGDGTLVFRIWDDTVLVRTLLNDDCKKPYRWEDYTARDFDAVSAL